PNVGKSTLFNVLTRTRDALVANLPGLTRDRHYGVCHLGLREFVVVDTGGLTDAADGIAGLMARQSQLAIDEADLVLFLADARDGLLPQDRNIVAELRRGAKPFVLVVNKIDGVDEFAALAEFAALGVAEPLMISSAHARGVDRLLAATLAGLPPESEGEPAP